MRRGVFAVLPVALLLAPALSRSQDKKAPDLHAGFAAVDITPEIGPKPVYVAGFGKNRKATGVHDPLFARAVVLQHDKQKIALVSVDLVGLFLPVVERVRQKLPGFDYVLVSSTHNHEGPDTMGLWGPRALQSGLDSAYMKLVEERIVQAVRQADEARQPVRVRIGVHNVPELLHDSRKPIVLHDELVALQFVHAKNGKNVGVIVQWNCHPETLDSRNTQISADYVGSTVDYLQRRLGCPAVYFTGTVGGLMTSLHVPIRDEDGVELRDGTFAKTERFGVLVGMAADKALEKSERVKLTPFTIRRRDVFLPMDNAFYLLGWKLGVLDRQAFVWQDSLDKAEPAGKDLLPKQKLAVQTEVAWLRLGELEIAAIPGEIYPELVLGKVTDPAEKEADFPDAPIEPAIYAQMKVKHRMLIGLANDELGYILPKRQWDEKAPFCYGQKRAPYGEVNSLGPETGPLLCRAFAELTGR